ncbi:putative adenylate/guanylate cyclase [Magnetofaba australis IT-1]|uniref:Putative adenylate/guanylate cyclase n=1 Tax=Magnetofaba australis IT-1 TaxID=1434232 RepID=A0A1Y2K7P1_9PROT|nr:putative adenylate/guanylate cyclase [Magnetofaba australis IT-1]
MQWTLEDVIDPRIVIVNIDDASLREEGRWPWSRSRIGELTTTLFDHYGVAAIGFDIIFAEPDPNAAGGARILRQLGNPTLEQAPWLNAFRSLLDANDPDRQFADALRDRPVALGFYFKGNDDGGARSMGVLPEPIIDAGLLRSAGITLPPMLSPNHFGGIVPTLLVDGVEAGFLDNPLVDDDGVFRKTPLLQRSGDKIYPTLALSLARMLIGSGYPLSLDEQGRWIKIGPLSIPLLENAATYIPFLGPVGSFRYVSAADVLNQRTSHEILQGTVVLVGATAAGLMDMRSTPVASVYPGVETHANLLSGILDGRNPYVPEEYKKSEVWALLVIGVFLGLLIPHAQPWKIVVMAIVVLGLWEGLALAFWQWDRAIIPMAAPLAMVLMLVISHLLFGLIVESRQRRQITKWFGQYIPPELVAEMSENEANYTLDGENREMTVLFADVRRFTDIAESMGPSELTQLMNAYLTPMSAIIYQNRGAIDKYMGDAIMAFWGAPLENAQHAATAIKTGLEMLEQIEQLHEPFAQRGWPQLKVGIGLGTGRMHVGNMGSEYRMAYTVMGDAVNLGSRLEGLTSVYKIPFIVSQTTRDAAPEYLYRKIDRVRVKGRTEPVTIYQPIGLTEECDEQTRHLITRHEQALSAYQSRQFEAAEELWRALKQDDERLSAFYQIFLTRIEMLRLEPPPADWSGVQNFSHK